MYLFIYSFTYIYLYLYTYMYIYYILYIYIYVRERGCQFYMVFECLSNTPLNPLTCHNPCWPLHLSKARKAVKGLSATCPATNATDIYRSHAAWHSNQVWLGRLSGSASSPTAVGEGTSQFLLYKDDNYTTIRQLTSWSLQVPKLQNQKRNLKTKQ